MMKKRLTVFVLSAAVLAGCSGNGTPETPTTATEAAPTETAAVIEEAATTNLVTESSATGEQDTTDPLAGLTLNQYEGLEMTAQILPRNAILPGMTVPVTVIITNTGEQSVAYVQGSGSFTTPQALQVAVDGLQPVLPEDQLGAATMDYVVKELNPGDTLEFTVNVQTIEPHESFDQYTYDLFNQNQVYIGSLSAEEFTSQYPDLTPAPAGTYEGTISFLYRTIESDEDTAPFGEATGYNQAPITITVTE